jgi:hypothetical protein
MPVWQAEENPPLTMATWPESPQSEPYDHIAAIWLQITMATRRDAPKPYDTNLMKSTMSKKFATSMGLPQKYAFMRDPITVLTSMSLATVEALAKGEVLVWAV